MSGALAGSRCGEREGWRLGTREGFEGGDEPGVKSGLIVDVAVRAVVDTLGPEGGETGVEILAHLAEVLVASITESADGVFHSGELWHGIAHEGLVVGHGVVRRIAFAPGADDDEEVFGFGQGGGFGVPHADDGGFEAGLFGSLGDDAGEFLGVPRFGSIEHGELALCGRGDHRRQGRARRAADPGKEAGKPDGLVAVESGRELIGELLLLGPKGWIRGGHGKGRLDRWWSLIYADSVRKCSIRR